MKFRSVLALGLVLAMSNVALAADGDKPADTKPGDTKPDVKGVRLTKPFSDLKDLTPEQTAKIKEIHKKYLAERKAMEEKQTAEEMAILTDDQKKEVAAMEKDKKNKPKAGGDKPAADPKTPTPVK